MEPVINPVWFYLTEVIGTLKVVIGYGGTSVLVIVFVLCMAEATTAGLDDKQWKRYKIGFIVLGITALIGLLLPSESTCYKMLVASYITPDNLNLFGESVTNAVDYIVESVDKIITAKQ